MDSVDVIVCWPKHLDYPLWRDFIKKHCQFFNKIFIVFTETHQEPDYSSFVEQDLGFEDNFVFLHPDTPPGEDWRNYAVNMALNESKSKWVWFTEQDLFILDPDFWANIRFMMDSDIDVIGYKDGNTRLHPCNLWVKRSWINKTNKDFGIVPDKLDHFARFYSELKFGGARIMYLNYDVADINKNKFYHMNGLSHNLTLVKNGEKVTYNEDEFAKYVYMTLNVTNVDERYEQVYKPYWDNYVAKTTET